MEQKYMIARGVPNEHLDLTLEVLSHGYTIGEIDSNRVKLLERYEGKGELFIIPFFPLESPDE